MATVGTKIVDTGHWPSSQNISLYISRAGSASIFRWNGKKGRNNNWEQIAYQTSKYSKAFYHENKQRQKL